jgi:hypothetical protein
VIRRPRDPWPALGLILVVTLLTYGILIPQLGFYRDDWYLFSTAQSHGPAGIIALFQIDRPLVGYLYAFGYQILGLSPLAWQVAALLIRLAGNLAFFWVLRLVWPERHVEMLIVALLFSVYPGFTVQPNAGVYITDLAASAAALFSFVLTIKALRSPRPVIQIPLSLLAGSLVLFYLGIFESAIGLEVARFGLVGYLIWRQNRAGIRAVLQRALKVDLLYLFLAGAFLIWRLLIFQSTRRSTNLAVLVGKYAALPVRSALSVFVETVKDVIETTVLAWVVPFYQDLATSNYRDLAIAVTLGVVVVTCILLVIGRSSPEAAVSQDDVPPFRNQHLIWLGTLIVVFTLLPIDLAGRNVLFADQWDRYTLYAAAGVAMVVGGFFFAYVDHSVRKFLLLVLIGMAVMVHYFSAASYRDSWTWQRDLWQQIVWRAPALQPGTMLFAIVPTAGFEEGYEIYGPANMVYYPGQDVVIGGEVLNSDTAANIELQKNREHYDRNVLVPDNYRNTLVAVYPSPKSCLHVLDGRKLELPGLLDKSLVADVGSYSRIDLIEAAATPAALPAFLGGGHPAAWCAYYQRMNLARQQGAWQEVAQLSDEALAKGLTPDDVSEWMPALDAYATLGRIQDAKHAASIIRSADAARSFLCLQLQRGAAYPPPYDYNQVNQLLCQAN